jgi:iron complex outermembrane receptor protein
VFGLNNAYVESGVQYVSRQIFAPRVITVREIKEAEEGGRDPFNGDASLFDFAKAPPGYYLFRAAAGFSVNTENVQYEFRLSGENLFNQQYRDYTNRFRYYADDLGRNVTFSIKFIF